MYLLRWSSRILRECPWVAESSRGPRAEDLPRVHGGVFDLVAEEERARELVREHGFGLRLLRRGQLREPGGRVVPGLPPPRCGVEAGRIDAETMGLLL